MLNSRLKRNTMKHIAVLLLTLLSTVGWSEDTIYQFSCDYPIYSDKEDAQIKQDFSFTMIVMESAEGELKAVMNGNAGATNLVVSRGAYGQFQFLEPTDGGNWILTTVVSQTETNEWPSVHSRHIWIVDSFVASQNFGTCTVR